MMQVNIIIYACAVNDSHKFSFPQKSKHIKVESENVNFPSISFNGAMASTLNEA